MTIQHDLQKDAVPGGLVELYTVDLNPVGVAEILYLTPNTNNGQSISFDGQVYTPFPIVGSGWEVSVDGKQPQPTLQVSNVTQFFNSYVALYQDLVGAKVTRTLTLEQYLDTTSYTRRNLLNYSQGANVTTSGWQKVNTVVVTDNYTAPDGTVTAERMREVATTPTSPYFYITQTKAGLTAGTYTFSCYLKAAERTHANLRVDDTAGTNIAQASINLTTGAVTASTAVGTVSNVSAVATDCNNGWWRLAITATWSSLSSCRVFVRPAIGTSNFTTDLGYAGDITKGVQVWGMQLEQASTASAYQHTGLDIQPLSASPETFGTQVFLINQMVTQTKNLIEFKLSSLIDRPGRKFPRGQVLRKEFPGAGLIRKD